MKLAIMQPALWPPAGYFRLFASSNAFVIFDTAQFMPKWYTHRQKLKQEDGTKDWCTLPIKKMPQTAKINEMEWQDDYRHLWQRQTKKFPILEGVDLPPADPLVFVVNSLLNACELLQIPLKVEMASHIDIPGDLRGQARIIAICKKLGATQYVNSPGGRALYDEAEFEKYGIKLTFLSDWLGSPDSILERSAHEDAGKLREEIYGQI